VVPFRIDLSRFLDFLEGFVFAMAANIFNTTLKRNQAL
jgi:hypothetical protein